MRNKSTMFPGEVLKWCSKCQTERDPADFSKNRSRPDGLNTWCRECTSRHKKTAYDPKKRSERYEANKDQIREVEREWYQKNREKALEYSAQWRADNPLKRREYERKRTALKRESSTGTVSYEVILDRDGYTCHLCGDGVDSTATWPHPWSLSFDHVVPLALGGSHTEDNIKVAHLRCNLERPRTELCLAP